MDNDSGFPDLTEMLESDSDPTARGIVQCLRMLVEEAGSLRLARTLAALQTAMTICADEGDTIAMFDAIGRRGMALH